MLSSIQTGTFRPVQTQYSHYYDHRELSVNVDTESVNSQSLSGYDSDDAPDVPRMSDEEYYRPLKLPNELRGYVR